MHGPYNVKVNVVQVVHTHYVKVVTYFNRTNRFNKLKDKKVTCAFKEKRRIKHCTNFLNMKPEERCLFRNTQLFQDLNILGTHVTKGGNNYQSCIVAGIKNLYQEINKHLNLSASTNQTESYWLLPLLCRPRSMKTRAWFAIMLSCHGFQDPQSLQYSQPTNWNANALWLTSHQTWDNTRDLYQTSSLHCLWEY